MRGRNREIRRGGVVRGSAFIGFGEGAEFPALKFHGL